jgi:hypothetical protein
MLSAKSRPSAVLVYWQPVAGIVCRVAAELGIAIGRDLDLIGWTSAETWDTHYAPQFKGAEVQPAVTWSVRSLAEAAIRQVERRSADPSSPHQQIRIPASLRTSI